MLLAPSYVSKSPFVVSGERLLNAVVVAVAPVPPLATGRTPDTSDDPKFTAPMNNEPLLARTTPVPSDAIVVVPFGATVSMAAPVEEATTNGFKLPEPCTVRLAAGVVVPTPTEPPVNTAAYPVPLCVTLNAGPVVLDPALTINALLFADEEGLYVMIAAEVEVAVLVRIIFPSPFTPFALSAYGAASSCLRGDISPSYPVPGLKFTVRYKLPLEKSTPERLV